jgi:hypothetical protein
MVGPSTRNLLRESMLSNQKWHSIRKAAANDPVLKDMLEQIEVYYTIKYDTKQYSAKEKDAF